MLTEDVTENVQAAFRTSWIERFCRNGVEEDDCDKSQTCPWLYDNITMDGATCLMPCCLMRLPEKQLVFGQFAPEYEETDFDFVNTKLAVLSRTLFAGSAEYSAQAKEMPESQRAYCASCQEQPLVPFAWPFPQWRVTLLDPQHFLAHLHFEELTEV